MIAASSSSGSSPRKSKRQKTLPKNAFDILLDSSKVCWPARAAISFSTASILEIVAGNGWFPWRNDDDEEARQNLDYSNVRILSRDMKTTMDAPKSGGPDFNNIVYFLNSKNEFNDDEAGFCHHCYTNQGVDGSGPRYQCHTIKCDTCADVDNCVTCECKNIHRYGPSLLQLDPRLNQNVEFQSLPLRERAKLLLRFLRNVASNFHDEYHKEWQKFVLMNSDEGWDANTPDLTLIDTTMMYSDTGIFINEFKVYNILFYNFIYHLLSTGWADNDCYTSPGSCSPFRGRLLGDGRSYTAWHMGHNERFDDIFQCFMHLHESNEEASVPPQRMMVIDWDTTAYTPSQIQYVPETIRRCVENCVDYEAASLLGWRIANSINIYRLVTETYHNNKEELSQIHWMPCLGVAVEDFVPLDDFQGYNPEHIHQYIDCTCLYWGNKDDDASTMSGHFPQPSSDS